jgi:hypothetical protein
VVTNGDFEQGSIGWELGDRAANDVKVVDEVFHDGAGSAGGNNSLRIVGPGEGYRQDWTLRSVTPETHLTFFTLLKAVTGESLPQALFHLYFYPDYNPIRYRIDITVTLENRDEYSESSFDPDPGTYQGGISVRFNRNDPNSWVKISLDISNLIRKHFPDRFDPRISVILLGSAEGGIVYYDDISIATDRIVNPIVQLGFFLYYNGIWQVVVGALISIGISALVKRIYERANPRTKSDDLMRV